METISKIALVIMFLVVVFKLGQALYFMMTDKDDFLGEAPSHL